jgi:hypothetical protein
LALWGDVSITMVYGNEMEKYEIAFGFFIAAIKTDFMYF